MESSCILTVEFYKNVGLADVDRACKRGALTSPARTPQSPQMHSPGPTPPFEWQQKYMVLVPLCTLEGILMSNDTSDPSGFASQISQPRLTKKRKRKDVDASQPHILHQSTFRKAAWSYFRLRLVTPETAAFAPCTPSTDDISLLTVLPILTEPLQAYLGITGAATPLDILKTSGRDVWIRVQRQDARVFRAAMSGWVGDIAREHVPGAELKGIGAKVKAAWRIKEEGETVLSLHGDGRDIFGG